jgi:ADP-ribose pyrophosphatase
MHEPGQPSAPLPRPHGPWTITETREVYRDPWVRLQRDEVVRPDGGPGSYAVAYLKPGVCVIAIDDEGAVHLTEEFHYGVGRVTLEGVSGGVEPGETPEQTAHKELAEELGIRAERLFPLGSVDPFTANVVSPTELFLAEGLLLGEPQPEGTEVIRRISMPFADAVEAVMEGEITHAPSCVAILKIWKRKRHAC